MALTKDDLHRLVTTKLQDYLIVIVSNREPYNHITTPNGIKCTVPARGKEFNRESVLGLTTQVAFFHDIIIDQIARIAFNSDGTQFQNICSFC
jgi:hypothetical protein